MTFDLRIEDDEDEKAAPEKWNRIRNNDPCVTHLLLEPTFRPSFYLNLATALQYNTNITHLIIDSSDSDIQYIPSDIFDPIFESSNYIETLEIHPNEFNIHDEIFRSFVKSKNNKITKLKMHLTKECAELLTTFISSNVMIENQMLKLILQRTIGTEAANKISDELFPSKSIKELYLYETYEYLSAATRPLMEAMETIGSLESLHIDLHQFDHKDINLIASLEKILFKNKKLKKLDLELREKEHQDLEKIALAIQKLPTLKSLHIMASIRNPPNNVIIEDVIEKWFPKISNKCVIGNYFHVYSSHYSNWMNR